MGEGIKSMVSVIVVMVFLFIVFRKRVLPVFQKKKIKAAVKPSAPDAKGSGYECDVLAFDVLAYEDLKTFAQDVSVQLTRKLDYVYTKAELCAVKYLAFGSIFLVAVEWHMKD